MAVAKNIKPTTKNSPAVVTGKNPNNKPAEAYDTRGTSPADGEAAVVLKGKPIDALRPSIGTLFKSQPDTKTDGIKIRGTGAATKGIKSRGPMA
jgi:hypothetical protein